MIKVVQLFIVYVFLLQLNKYLSAIYYSKFWYYIFKDQLPSKQSISKEKILLDISKETVEKKTKNENHLYDIEKLKKASMETILKSFITDPNDIVEIIKSKYENCFLNTVVFLKNAICIKLFVEEHDKIVKYCRNIKQNFVFYLFFIFIFSLK